MGPKETEFDGNLGPIRLHSLAVAGQGVREPISPGGGEGAGYNSLPRTIRIAVWEIFSEGLRGLGNFFRGFSRYGKIILGQKILIVRARAPSRRQYATPRNFSRPQSCFCKDFPKNIHECRRKNAKSTKKFTRTHTIKSLFLLLCEVLCEV